MPLSEHEQRMLDQIESALYAEDPKFASQVKGAGMRAPRGGKLLAAAAFILGLLLLVVGVAVPGLQWPANFPILSLVGFLVMFGAGVSLVLGIGKSSMPGPTAAGSSGRQRPSGGRGGKNRQSGGFTARMEERFHRRFDQ